jgi:hypothetical protein
VPIAVRAMKLPDSVFRFRGVSHSKRRNRSLYRCIGYALSIILRLPVYTL